MRNLQKDYEQSAQYQQIERQVSLWPWIQVALLEIASEGTPCMKKNPVAKKRLKNLKTNKKVGSAEHNFNVFESTKF